MNTTNSGLPGYEMVISDEDYWESIEFALSEIRDLLSMRFETRIEAIGEQVSPPDANTGKRAEWKGTTPTWEDPEAGGPVKAWNLLPYVNALDQIDVHERFEIAASLLTSVERRITTTVALDKHEVPDSGIDFHGKHSRPILKGISLANGRFLLRPHQQHAGAPWPNLSPPYTWISAGKPLSHTRH